MNSTQTTILSIILATAVLMVGALFITSDALAQFRCYESRSMCRDIEDLGDEVIDEFPNPMFLDARSDELVDTWGAARRNGATHEGTDILTERGAYIVMPTDGVVDRTGVSGLGGKHVFIYIGGGEKLYFAHLEDWADGLSDGDELKKGDLVGYVGNTGAEYTVPHLHLTIYKDGVAANPYPRMKDTDWSLRNQMKYLKQIIDDADDEQEEAEFAFERYGDVIRRAIREDIAVAEEIEDILNERSDEVEEEKDSVDSDTDEAQKFDLFEENLSMGNGNDEEIERLQKFLNKVEGEDIDVDGEFDRKTEEAVKRFQEKYKKQVLDIWGLEEASGFVGITTRLKMNFLIQAGATTCPVFVEYNSLRQNVRSDEVRETQRLLQDLGFFDSATDGFFDQDTHEAMIEFQETFSATMLKPWGLTRGTGYKYKTTNKFMNYLRGCDTGAVDLEGRGSFDF